jgi:arylsulfatase A-like enzyme
MTMMTVNKKVSYALLILCLAILGSYCGLEIDSFVEDLPFFQISTLLLFINVLCVLLIPLLLYVLSTRINLLRKNRAVKAAILMFNSFYFHLAVLLALYKTVRHMEFDFNFFWYNISVAWSVLWKLFAPWLVLIFVSLIAFVFLQRIIFEPVIQLFKKCSWKAGFVLGMIVIAGLVCQYSTIASIRGSAAGFLYASFFSDRQLRTEYHNLYKEHLRKLEANKIQGSIAGDASKLGDMIIMVQQESLNGLFLGPKITPQLLQAAQNGILFSQLYGNSIQSERGYECILCGVPPSIAGELVEDYPVEDVRKIGCLPRLFKALGYKPILFYGGNPNPRATRLFEAIGFEKILADDIMKPEDVMYDWGYREDIWFTRVDDYIQKHLRNEKVFIFITASATNHTPFKILDKRFQDKAPFPHPVKFEENIANTTFVQDAYFGHLYGLYKKHYADKATLIAVSDHSWPIGRHKHNIYNERGAFDENFRIALLLIPPSSTSREFAIGANVTQRFCQIDILPSILELVGVKQDYWLGESFAPWLLASPERTPTGPRKTKISIQPYGGGFISALRYPDKYLFDLLGKNVKVFDLQKDPGELSPKVHNVEQYISLIRDYFRN